MHRIFVDEKNINGNNIFIDKKKAHHLINVLRLEVNEKVEAITNSSIYISELYEVKNEGIFLKVVEKLPINEERIKVRLFQGLSKGDKMETVFKACTEIGVSEFFPVKMSRSIPNIDKKVNQKVERWQKIVESAAKQSKRNYIPKVNVPVEFKDILNYIDEDEVLIAPYENEENNNLKNILPSLGEKVSLIVGPEGGFSFEEIEFLKDRAKIITLGNNILRTETAAIVASYTILYELEAKESNVKR